LNPEAETSAYVQASGHAQRLE